jgi:hypothetical protein
MFLLLTLAFAHSCTLRAYWFGRLNMEHHHWLTGITLLITRNWYHEGPFQLHWLMLEAPKSVEFRTLSDRYPYISCPPGPAIPVYLAALASGSEPTPKLVMGYNLANHFLTVLLVAVLGWRLVLAQCGAPWLSAAAGTTAGLIALFNPVAMYFQDCVFFEAQSVILPFVAFVTLEVLGREQPGRLGRSLRILQYLVMLYGFTTDWLFVFVMAATLLKRGATGELGATTAQRVKNVCVFSAGPAVALFAYLAQIHSVNGFERLFAKALQRFGVSETGTRQLEQVGGFFDTFWGYYFPVAFGRGIGVPVLLGCTAIFVLVGLVTAWNRRVRHRSTDPRIRQLLVTAWLLLVPCFIQIHVFRHHSAYHSFSVLKFSPAMAIVPFCLLPLLVGILCERIPINGMGSLIRPMVVAGVVSGLVYTGYFYSHVTETYFIRRDSRDIAAATKVRSIARESDVAFSPDFEWTVEAGFPQLRAMAMKCVYQVQTPRAIEEKVKDIDRDFTILLIFAKPPGPQWSALLKGRTPVALQETPFNLLVLRIPPRDLRAAVEADGAERQADHGPQERP